MMSSAAQTTRTDGPRVAAKVTTVDLRAVLTAIWHETHPHRAAIHRSLPHRRCDLQFRIGGTHLDGISTVHLDGDCACRDFLVDMIAEGCRVLADRGAGELRNPPGAARAHVRIRAAGDWFRHRRTEMGAQARIDRIRAGARGRALPSDFHRALLEYLVDEAGSMAPLEGHDALLYRLVARCVAEFGGAPEQYMARVTDGIRVVERHCRSGPRVNAGTAAEPDYVTWWERYIERPLGRRPRRTDVALPIAADANGRNGLGPACPRAARDLDRVVDASDPSGDDVMIVVLVDAFRLRPDEPITALRAGVFDLVTRGLLSERSAAALLSDRDRVATAAKELSALA